MQLVTASLKWFNHFSLFTEICYVHLSCYVFALNCYGAHHFTVFLITCQFMYFDFTVWQYMESHLKCVCHSHACVHYLIVVLFAIRCYNCFFPSRFNAILLSINSVVSSVSRNIMYSVWCLSTLFQKTPKLSNNFNIMGQYHTNNFWSK